MKSELTNNYISFISDIYRLLAAIYRFTTNPCQYLLILVDLLVDTC
jgi:hypothetical protein